MDSPAGGPPALPPPDYSDRGPGVVACAVVGIVVATLAVLLRFWSRRIASSLYIWWDDWAIIATLLFSNAFLSVNIYWTTIGLGQHTWMTPLELVPRNTVTNCVALVLYSSTIWMIKTSALTFYARIFRLSKTFVKVLWAVGGICTAWWIVTCIVPWTFCDPIEMNVNPLIPGVCRDSMGWYIGSAFTNAFLDLVILVLPVPATWRLKMSARKRVAVLGVFLLGYVSAFLSFARFIIIVRDPSMLEAGPGADPSCK
ncbi:hypothetical protein B0I35DRAFT_233374 [Stachybotrys elegans]|uniref:Rhodopsin domain-containing protein n=1 Tax=Stachybotrys elegans TaxID=80388 RepID=A0A8K0SP82_9HYPO|nr:hypothetical protein B0I35DRAFT_233374 [Stachybotrys elegans]